MLGLTGPLGATGRKLILVLAIPILILVACSGLNLPTDDAWLAIVGFFVGMLFPDLDIITGFIRTTFQTMLLILFMGGAILVFNPAWNHAGPFCPVQQINSILPDFDAMVACKFGLAAILMLAAYVLSWLLVAWIPQKDSFHHWGSMVMVAGGLGMLVQVMRITSNPWPLTIGFGAGYFMHIAADKMPAIPAIFPSKKEPSKKSR